MRGTILPYAIILTKTRRAAVSIVATEIDCGLSTVSKVFFVFFYNPKVFLVMQS